MTKEFKLALEALARAAGLTVEYACTRCDCERTFGDGSRSEMVTFEGPNPEDDKE